MSTQSIIQQVRWQDLEVRSEVDIVLEIAQNEGWEDCEIFGYGNMITQPQESTGWKLIPADLYGDNIPPEAVVRLHRIINAGIRVQGVIIADDGRRTETPPAPAQPKISLPSVTEISSFIGRGLSALDRALVGLGKVLIGLIIVAGVIAFISTIASWVIHFAPIMIILGLIVTIGSSAIYDPKLVILVDDGKGGTVWVSVFTWYD
jgi:hypothetical protein